MLACNIYIDQYYVYFRRFTSKVKVKLSLCWTKHHAMKT